MQGQEARLAVLRLSNIIEDGACALRYDSQYYFCDLRCAPMVTPIEEISLQCLNHGLPVLWASTPPQRQSVAQRHSSRQPSAALTYLSISSSHCKCQTRGALRK